jgi:PDZ domain
MVSRFPSWMVSLVVGIACLPTGVVSGLAADEVPAEAALKAGTAKADTAKADTGTTAVAGKADAVKTDVMKADAVKADAAINTGDVGGAVPAGVAVDPETIGLAIRELESPEYVVRELAEKRLAGMGLTAVPQLTEAAKSPLPETSVRAIEVLAQLYRKAEFPAANSLEDAISDLRQAPGAVGEVAQRSWKQNALNRDERTVAKLTELGARVQNLPEDDPRALARKAAGVNSAIQFIVISRKWKGGDAGLKLLERLSQANGVQVYHVNGAQVSDEAMAGVADLGFYVDRRGAFLGISNDGDAAFGPRNGCLVGVVTEKGPAAEAGIQRGDRIVKFGDEDVRDFEDLITFLKKAEPGDVVEFGIIRDGEPQSLKVTLGNW